MGSGCCKSNDVHPQNLSGDCIRMSLFNEEGFTNTKKGLTELTVHDSLTTQSLSIHWQRGDLIGQGVFGKVYQAMNLDTGELLAVKTYSLSPQISTAERELINIKRELSILRSLDHPNIIKYFQVDYSQETNSIDIVTEYVPSGSMLSLLEKYKGFSESVIRNYTRQLLEGLAYLHSNDVMHRDLKSANILITEDSTLKLSDFGCSRRFGSNDNPQSKSFKGSPYWMAPEMVRNEGHSYPADIWSLGCLVIEMVSGSPPWSNYSKFSKEVLKLIARDNNLPDIPNVSKELKEFILMCLDRDPEARGTAKELLRHEFITAPGISKCYSSIRSSVNVSNSVVVKSVEIPKDL